MGVVVTGHDGKIANGTGWKINNIKRKYEPKQKKPTLPIFLWENAAIALL